MGRRVGRTMTVLGGEIHVGDVIRIGGFPLRVVDVRVAAGMARRRLVLEDGNFLILGAHQRVEVTRVVLLPSTAPVGKPPSWYHRTPHGGGEHHGL